MSITLKFAVKPGDTFHYQSSFTSRGGTNTMRSSEKIVAVTNGNVHVVQPDDPDALEMVYDPRGYPIDVRQNGASVKDDMPGEVFDISNQLIFPPGSVNPGDTWEANDGVVHISYKLIGVGTIGSREVAEVHSTQSSYTGPIKHWVELSTGRLVRKEYLVGAPGAGTTTLIERV
jgi:hypothetical protein